MAKNDITFEDFIDFLAEHVAARIAGLQNDEAPAKSKGRKSKAKAEPEPEEDEEEAEEEESDFDADARRAELKKKQIKTLRKMALDLEFDEEEVSEANKETLIDSIVEAEAEEAGAEPDDEEEEDEDEEEEEEEDDEEDEDEESEYDRDDLEAMTLPALKKIAKESRGSKPSELKGLDKDSVIDLIMGEESDEEDEDEDDDDGDEWYTREELDDMSDAELKALCKDNGITVPRGAKHKKLVDLLADDE